MIIHQHTGIVPARDVTSGAFSAVTSAGLDILFQQGVHLLHLLRKNLKRKRKRKKRKKKKSLDWEHYLANFLITFSFYKLMSKFPILLKIYFSYNEDYSVRKVLSNLS